jgi:hypothetical protein
MPCPSWLVDLVGLIPEVVWSYTEATFDLARKNDRDTCEGRYPVRFFARIPAIPMVTSVLLNSTRGGLFSRHEAPIMAGDLVGYNKVFGVLSFDAETVNVWGLLLLLQLDRAHVKERSPIRGNLNTLIYLLRLEVGRLDDHAVTLTTL